MIILTAVDHVAINFGQDNQQELGYITVSELKQHILENQFAKGSMLPKVLAGIDFVENTGNEAIITGLNNINNLIAHNSGTHIVADSKNEKD